MKLLRYPVIRELSIHSQLSSLGAFEDYWWYERTLERYISDIGRNEVIDCFCHTVVKFRPLLDSHVKLLKSTNSPLGIRQNSIVFELKIFANPF